MRLGSTACVLAQGQRPRIAPVLCHSPCSSRWAHLLLQQNKPHPREGLQEVLCLAGEQDRCLGASNLADSLGDLQGSSGHRASHPAGGCQGDLCSGPTEVKLSQAQRCVWTELGLPHLTMPVNTNAATQRVVCKGGKGSIASLKGKLSLVLHSGATTFLHSAFKLLQN